MVREAASPPSIWRSIYGPEPRKRVAELPGIVSVGIEELFSDIPREIYSPGDDLAIIRKATEDALAKVNLSMIRPEDTVNILCSEHGFNILDGEPYAEMIRAIRDVVEERTGCKEIRLRVAAGIRQKEGPEIIEHYAFDRYFGGKAKGFDMFDKGVPIETEIGTLYGVARAYDADWIVHTHYNDLRELYWHRMIDRPLKPFAMSYARIEGRAVYHCNFGPRSSMFVARMIFNSPFVQKKFTFGCFLMTSTRGVIGVDADNDLSNFDKRETVVTLKSYGKPLRLITEIDECIAVLDTGRWSMYQHAGGITFGNLVTGKLDFLDLETVPAGTGFALFERAPGAPKTRAVNPAIKALVVNHMWMGMMCTELAKNIPTIVVGRDLADMLIKDSANPEFMDYAMTAESPEAAIDFARRIAKTDNIIVFDGTFGSINLSPTLADFMLKKAPEVSRKVDTELLPKWLKQRGLDVEELH
jgi:hypothetical protein